MNFDEWIKTQGDRSAAWKRGAEETWDYQKNEIDKLKKQVAHLEALLYGEEK